MCVQCVVVNCFVVVSDLCASFVRWMVDIYGDEVLVYNMFVEVLAEVNVDVLICDGFDAECLGSIECVIAEWYGAICVGILVELV